MVVHPFYVARMLHGAQRQAFPVRSIPFGPVVKEHPRHAASGRRTTILSPPSSSVERKPRSSAFEGPSEKAPERAGTVQSPGEEKPP